MLPLPFLLKPFHRCLKASFLVLLGFFLLGIHPVAATACRLLAVISSKPQPELSQQVLWGDLRSLQAQASLQEPAYQLAGQSIAINVKRVQGNKDGVGWVGFAPPAPQEAVASPPWRLLPSFHSATALVLQPDVFRSAVAPLLPQTAVWLAHLREASVGGVDAKNNHPFLLTAAPQAGGTWAFAANGSTWVSDAQYKRWTLKRFQNEGLPENDSKRLFHVLLSQLEAEVARQKAPVLTEAVLVKTLPLLAERFASLMAAQRPTLLAPFDASQPLESAQAGYLPARGEAGLLHPESRFFSTLAKNWIMSNGSYTLAAVHDYPLWYRLSDNAAGETEAITLASEPTTDASPASLYQPLFRHTRWQQIPTNTLILFSMPDSHLQMRWFPIPFYQQARPLKPRMHGPTPAQSDSARCRC